MIPSYQTHNAGPVSVGGTTLRLTIDASFEELRELFGDPMPGGDEYTTMEWHILFGDGQVATVYDYYGVRWSVGAHASHGAWRVSDLLKLHREAQDLVS